ncbi:hypothetical protein CVT26_008924 [Gymnopilus dilepis]|uniref:Uncharacterized protein n=1 Tax=Gymnopilus dilepis TaxID=231916 RepID=A0A409YRP9_9AGAR|nr:hypothetical protein CVT26_008924 [Gymnopilus dilepis]
MEVNPTFTPAISGTLAPEVEAFGSSTLRASPGQCLPLPGPGRMHFHQVSLFKVIDAGQGNNWSSSSIVETKEENDEGGGCGSRRSRVVTSHRAFFTIFSIILVNFRGRIQCPPPEGKNLTSDTASTPNWAKLAIFLSTPGGQKFWISVSDLSQDNRGSSQTMRTVQMRFRSLTMFSWTTRPRGFVRISARFSANGTCMTCSSFAATHSWT